MLRLGMWASRFVVPFDLARFFALHFTKVGAQTELMMRSWLALTAEQQAPSGALRSIFDAMMEKRSLALPAGS